MSEPEQRHQRLFGRGSDRRVLLLGSVDELRHHGFDEGQVQGSTRVLGQEDEDGSRQSLDFVGGMIHRFAESE